MKPPAVVDTNVVVAGLITSAVDSPVARVLDGMLAGAFSFLVSTELLDEYREVLFRPKISGLHGLSETQVDRILGEIIANAMLRSAVPGANAPDRGDDHLWALLQSSPGAVLVTGDKRLLENPPSFGSVVTAADYLSIYS